MTEFLAEFIGTMLLILLGLGVVANVVLDKTKGNAGGFLLINFAWGLAVYVGVVVAGPYSGAHLNPAVTIGLAVAGKFAWSSVLPFVVAQILGAAVGSVLVVGMYWDHFRATDNLDAKLGVFCTAPAIKNTLPNFLSEFLGTLVLLLGVFYIVGPAMEGEDMEKVKMGLGSIGALPVALFVTVIGMALGGTTGYAINPTRDLIPRIMHAILPIGDKRDSDWSYSWIPVIAPLLAAVAAAFLYQILGS